MTTHFRAGAWSHGPRGSDETSGEAELRVTPPPLLCISVLSCVSAAVSSPQSAHPFSPQPSARPVFIAPATAAAVCR